MAALRCAGAQNGAHLLPAQGLLVLPLAPGWGLREYQHGQTREQRLARRTSKQRSDGRRSSRSGPVSYSRAAVAPPRGVTFPIPVDYTQVGPALAGITDELGMLMDYAIQLPLTAPGA